MRQVYAIVVVLLGITLGVQGYNNRGYQNTLDRAQMDRSRRMYTSPEYQREENRSMTGRPLDGSSWRSRTQEMEAENLASDMQDM